MMSKPRALLAVAAVLVAAQGIAIGGYILVEHRREPLADNVLEFEELSVALPTIELKRADTTLSAARLDTGIVLLHVWATWCRPCREELPAILALDDQLDARVIAASSDEGWQVIEHYFQGEPPPTVARIASGGEALPVEALPTSFVVVDGWILARLTGARGWSLASAQELLSRVGNHE